MIAAAVLLGWVVMALVATVALQAAIPLFDRRARPTTRRRVVVIVSVEGANGVLADFTRRLLAQDHRDFRVVFAISGPDDNAWSHVTSLRRSRRPLIDVAESGTPAGCSQETWNILAALQHLTVQDEVVVFARPEILPPADWLSVLDWSVIDQRQPFVTSLQMMTPADRSFAARALASLSVSFAGAPKPGSQTLAWGGSSAMSAAFLRSLSPAHALRGAMDPLAILSLEALSRGVPTAVQRSSTMPTPFAGKVPDAIARARRDLMPLFRHRPAVFALALAAALLPIAGASTAILGVFRGSLLAIAPLAVVSVLMLWRARLRAGLIRRFVREGDCADRDGWIAFDRRARPVWWLLLLPALLLATGRKVTLGRRAYLWTRDGGARFAMPDPVDYIDGSKNP
jgi:hypothetical protein